MREDPYTIRTYVRRTNEPVVTAADLPPTLFHLRPLTQRLLLLFLTLYLLIAIFLLTTAVTHAASAEGPDRQPVESLSRSAP